MNLAYHHRYIEALYVQADWQEEEEEEEEFKG
jgi:hypothetical protein